MRNDPRPQIIPDRKAGTSVLRRFSRPIRPEQRELPLAEPVEMFATESELGANLRMRAAQARAFGAEARLKIVEGERDQALLKLNELRRALYQVWNTSRPVI